MAPTEYDVAVVGVGGMGSATAYHLARRGVDVLGIERFDVPHARGSSHGLTRILRLPQYEDPAYVPLVRRALELWNRLDAGYDRALFHRTGTVDFGTAESEMVAGARRSCELHDIPYEAMTGPEVRDRFPGYDLPDGYRAIYQPDGGFLHAEQCVVAHVDAAHAHGATIRARERLDGWEADESGVRVSTDRGSYTAETLVATTGAWTGQLFPALSPHLRPERQVLAWFQPAVPERFSPERFPAFVADVPGGHYYGVPAYAVPGFKLGKFNHRGETGTPAELDREPTRADERLLREFADSYFPAGAGPTMRLSTCLFTNTPDGDFVLDVHPDHENVVVGAGFSGHGFKFATAIGELLADLALGDEPARSVEPFRFSRLE